MAVTANRSFNVPATGADVDLWGQNDLNPNFNLLDKNLGAVNAVGLSNVNVTLNATQLSYGVIRLTGALTASVQVFFPAIQGWWTIDNQCTGAFFVVINITGSPGRLIGVPQGIATDIYLDGTNVNYRNPQQIGSYWDYAGDTVPAWVLVSTVPPYLVCDGSTYSAVTYPYLNTILGTTTLPDMRGRSRAFLNAGTGRITGAGSGIDGNTRGSGGGLQNTTLLQNQLPNVTLSLSGNLTDGAINVNDAKFSVQTSNLGALTIFAPGSGSIGITASLASTALTGITAPLSGGGATQPFLNMQPTCIGGITMIRAA